MNVSTPHPTEAMLSCQPEKCGGLLHNMFQVQAEDDGLSSPSLQT
jgi:hypothetical protein